MKKRVIASQAKSNFGILLDEVTALGRVDIMKHGRRVAVVLSPREFERLQAAAGGSKVGGQWGATHMIPSELAHHLGRDGPVTFRRPRCAALRR
jgi:prevent-host-death family protein